MRFPFRSRRALIAESETLRQERDAAHERLNTLLDIHRVAGVNRRAREAELIQANNRQHDRIVELHCAVERAAQVFLRYADTHQRKDPPDLVKAEANQALAMAMCKAIGVQHPARLPAVIKDKPDE